MRSILIFSFILVTATIMAQSTSYYTSNDGMLEVEEISESEAAEHEYVLRKNTSGKLTQRSVLYHNGEIAKVLRESFDDDGNILTYAIDDQDGVQIEYRKYAYNVDGFPRSIQKTLADGSTEVVVFTVNQTTGRTNISQGVPGAEYEREYYNKEGNILFMERWQGTNLLYKEDYEYDNGILQKKISEDITTGEYIESEYIANLVVVENRHKDLRLVSTFRYTYDNEDRISSKTQETVNGVLQTRYSYDEQGAIVQEIETLDGIPTSIIEYLPDAKKVELRYRAGRLILRREYEGERPVAEYQYSESGGIKIERTLRIPE